MRVALVHDDLVQWGGAERMLLALSDMFPKAPIYTSVYDSSNQILKERLKSKKVITSFLQKIPGWRNVYQALLPLYPIAFEQFDFSDYDLVISQTTRFAKSILTKPQTKHICYCHTPPRFLHNFSGEKNLGALWLLERLGILGFLRNYDRIASHRVDSWVAGSRNAENRIKKVYGVESEVIYPFVDLQRFKSVEVFDGGYLLVIARLNFYKRVDLVVKAANKLQTSLKVVGTGPCEGELKEMAGPYVEFLGRVEEGLVSLLLAGCKALVVAGEEDFGLTPLEAQALGKPVIAYKAGGVLETVIEGESGYFFESQTVESLISALHKLEENGYNKKACQAQVLKFSREKFETRFRSLIHSS